MPEDTQRLDQWLWQARFFKSRTLAARMLRARKLRMDHVIIAKPSRNVRIGAVLTFPQGSRIRVVEVLKLAARRGPAREAAALYRDLTPVAERPKTTASPVAKRGHGEGRPTKKDRRAVMRLKGI